MLGRDPENTNNLHYTCAHRIPHPEQYRTQHKASTSVLLVLYNIGAPSGRKWRAGSETSNILQDI